MNIIKKITGNNQLHSYRTRSSAMAVQIHCIKSKAVSSFKHSTSLLWNGFNLHIQSIVSLFCFKKSVKKHLFQIVKCMIKCICILLVNFFLVTKVLYSTMFNLKVILSSYWSVFIPSPSIMSFSASTTSILIFFQGPLLK